jgi:hypothetical protein
VLRGCAVLEAANPMLMPDDRFWRSEAQDPQGAGLMSEARR